MAKYYKKMSICEDGEIIDEKVVPFYSPFKEGKGYNFKYKSINIKSYLDIPIPECFSDAEVGKIYRLSRYIFSDSNLLAKRRNNEIVPISKQDIQVIVGLHRTKFNPFFKKLVDEKILKQVELSYKYYCFNPLFFNSTSYLPLYLFAAFQDELKEYLPKWVMNKYLDMHEKSKDVTDCKTNC